MAPASELVPLARLVGSTAGRGDGWQVCGAALSPRREIAEWLTLPGHPGCVLRISGLTGAIRFEHEPGFVPLGVSFSPGGGKLLILPPGAGGWRDVMVLADQEQLLRFGDLDRPGHYFGPGPAWPDSTEVLAGAWLDEESTLLAGRLGGQAWAGILGSTGDFAMTWRDSVRDRNLAQGWASCTRNGLVVFDILRKGEEIHPDGFVVVDRVPGVSSPRSQSWHWLIPKPKQVCLTEDSTTMVLLKHGQRVPHVLPLEQNHGVECPNYDAD